MRTRRKQTVLWILTILWMGMIFWFSAQSGEDSSALSGGITGKIVRIIWQDFDGFSTEQQELILGTASFFVRKLAHFTEYAILGVLWSMVLSGYLTSITKHSLAAFLIGSAYACTDEAHQLFVAERAGMLADVGIDSAGVLAGVLVTAFILYFCGRKNEKNK